MFRAVGKDYGLEDGDIEGRPMGQNGVDIILSPKAMGFFRIQAECKKMRRVVVPTQFAEHYAKYETTASTKVLFSENDRGIPLATLKAEDLLGLYRQLFKLEEELCDWEGRNDR